MKQSKRDKEMGKVVPNYVKACLLLCMGTVRDSLVQYKKNMEKIRKAINEAMTGLTWFI